MNINHYPKFSLAFLFFILLVTTSFGQVNNKISVKESFGTSNYVNSYSEDITAVSQILNTTNTVLIEEGKEKLKQFYEDMNGTTLNDSELGALMAANTGNYSTWMSVYSEAQSNYPEDELYILRSVIVNIKKKM